jgi:hypothetical protein
MIMYVQEYIATEIVRLAGMVGGEDDNSVGGESIGELHSCKVAPIHMISYDRQGTHPIIVDIDGSQGSPGIRLLREMMALNGVAGIYRSRRCAV